jgi:thiamine-monophosphate kinase
MMDLSDGLASDLRHICERSGAGARIRAGTIPISTEARTAAASHGQDALQWALRGGEDYQLLFTLALGSAGALGEILRDTGSSAAIVGEITPSDYTVLYEDGREEPLSPQAFDHFAGG